MEQVETKEKVLRKHNIDFAIQQEREQQFHSVGELQAKAKQSFRHPTLKKKKKKTSIDDRSILSNRMFSMYKI